MLFIYHLLKIWPEVTVFGVTGFSESDSGDESVSHVWVEVEGFLIDLTADQYNQIDDRYLNLDILSIRPYLPVYVDKIDNLFHYDIFFIKYRYEYDLSLSNIARDFIHDMELAYSQLMTL